MPELEGAPTDNGDNTGGSDGGAEQSGGSSLPPTGAADIDKPLDASTEQSVVSQNMNIQQEDATQEAQTADDAPEGEKVSPEESMSAAPESSIDQSVTPLSNEVGGATGQATQAVAQEATKDSGPDKTGLLADMSKGVEAGAQEVGTMTTQLSNMGQQAQEQSGGMSV